MTRSPARILRRVSLCSSLAIATALVLGPSQAAAQSFEANNVAPVTTNGAVVTTSPSLTDIALNGGQTVIDWTPNDTAISGSGIGFQLGGTATFHSANDFAVLNRINPVDPTRIISMAGNIVSTVAGQTGGSVYFYSPAGIVLGPGALINVGSLVLTTSPVEVTAGQFIGGVDGTTVKFGQANPNSFIFTSPFSTINALNGSSYVAMVAPRVGHDGTINVNGAAALVAAEAATISFNTDGLFNITVDVGTDEAQNEGIEVNGTITGPASSGVGDNHRAYLVAVPKNDLLTMAIGSGADLGFDIAGAADVVGNAVILSAGHDIVGGNTSDAPSAAAGALADITLTNNNFTSALYGRASGEALVGANSGGSSSFASDVSLRAGGRVRFFSDNPGSSVTVGGNLTLSANAEGLNDGDSALAGIVQLMTSGGGSLSVAGSTQLTAIGTGGESSNPLLASGDGRGGTILIQSTTGGDLSLGDTLSDTFTADASGHGGSFFSDGGFIDGGDGIGGTVNVFTSGDSSMVVAGTAGLTANGRAGQPNDCFQCGGVGGIGDAGNVNVQAHTDNDPEIANIMTFGNGLTISANGLGGSGQVGGLGDGGDVIVTSRDQSLLTVTGNLSVSATGRGGNASGANAVVGDGGDGFGGDSDVSADNGTLTVTGSFDTFLSGDGGSSELGNGGYGQGGFGELFAWNNGSVAVGLYSSIRADGTGGDGLASGGEGQGGSAYFSSSSGGTVALGLYASLIADGEGGRAYNVDNDVGNGGLGEGGHVEAYANDATLGVQGTLIMSADGSGGDAGDGMDAGDSLGGDVFLQAVNGGALTVAGGLYASAVGIGTYIGSSATNSGDGTGGTINIYSRDGDSMLTVSGPADLNADGVANAEGECFPCGGIGGIGQGGTIDISSQGVTGVAGNVLTFGNSLLATANGYGGNGIGGASGDGIGGTVTLNAADGNRTNVAGNVTLEARGSGGFDDFGLVGGNGTGGLARITTTGTGGSLMTLSSNAVVDASGLGGNSQLTVGGTGGTGQSGRARVMANGGAIAVTGDLTLESISSGGSGDNGGDGIAFIGANPINTATSDARIVAYGGSISVTGVTTLDVRASGGTGAEGGSGGDASGGYAAIHARNSNLAPSTVTLGTVIVDADAEGGAGGAGISGNAGTPGGDGGSATGGFVVITAAAGNGHVTAGTVALSASALGGAGGDSGNGDGLPTGDGGDGGSATGGTIFAGAESGLGEALASNTGTANFGSITALANATGGNGGFGNFGSPGGNGGAGGFGDGGLAILQTRGALVTVGLVDLMADGTGGDGGGSEIGVGGVGGDGIAGEVGVIATNRAGALAQRGTLDAGVLFANATGTGGFGSTSGASIVEGGSVFQVENADATIDAVNIQVAGDTVLPGSDESRITVINGSVLLTGGFDDGEAFHPGDFTFITPGDLSLYLSNSTLTTETLTLTAGDFVPDSVNLPPGNPGTIFATDAIITTGNNFIADVNIDTVNDLTIIAGGLIQFDQAISGGAIDMWAQGGSITIEGVDAGTSLHLLAGTSINTDDISAGTTVSIEAQGGSVGTGHIVAGGDVSLTADTLAEGGDVTTNGNILAQTGTGNVDFQNLTGFDVILDAGDSILLSGIVDASGTVDFSAIGDINTGDITGGFVGLQTGGAVAAGDITSDTNIQVQSGFDMDLGNLVAGLNVDVNSNKAIRLNSGGSIVVGNATALGGIDFDALGSVTGFDITSGEEVFATADGAISFGAVSAGLVNPQPPTGNPFSIGMGSGTSISVGGLDAVNGVLLVTAGTLTTGDINAGGDVLALAGGNMSLGSIIAGPSGRTYLADVSMWEDAGGNVGSGDSDVDPEVIFAAPPVATGGSIDILGPVSTGSFQAAGASIDVGNIDAGSFIEMFASGSIGFGSLVAGTFVTIDPTDIVGGDVTALAGDVDMTGDSIAIGNVSASDNVLLTALAGDLSTGTIDAGIDITLDASGDVTTGAITAAGSIDATGASLTLGNLNANSVALTTTVADLTVGNIIIPGNLTLTTAGDLVFGDLDAFNVDLAATDSITGGDITAGGYIDALSGGAMTLANLAAGTTVLLDSGAAMSFGNATAQTGSVEASAVGSMSFLDISAGTFVTIDPTDIVGGDVTALAGDVDMTGNSIAIGNVSASDNVLLTALAGDLSTGTIDAGINVTLDASGDITTGHITAGGLIDATGASLTLGNLSANSIALTTTVADLTVGNVTIPGDLDLTTAGDLVFGDLEAFNVDLAATGSISGGDIDSATDITALAGTSMSLGDLEAGGFFIETFLNGDIDLTAGGGITTLTQSAFGAIDLAANGGALQFGDANALFGLTGSATGSILGGNIVAADIDLAGNGVTTGNLSSDNDVILISTASIQTGNVDVFSGVEMDATGSILAGDITASTIDLFAGGDITTGDLTTQFLAQIDGGIGLLLFPGASITLESGGDIATGNIDSIDGVYANAGGGIATGAIDAVDFVQLLAGGDIATGNIFAGSFIDIFSSGGGIATGDLTGTEIDLEANGDISFADVDADSLDFEATGAVDGGDISAFSFVLGEAEGAITLGDIIVGPGLPPIDDFSVGIASATSISVGDVSGTDRVGFATLGDLTTGDLSASDLIMTLIGGDISVGSMSTTAPNGEIYMADAQMYLDAGGAVDDFDASLVLSEEPVPTGGSITINGPVSTGQFRAAAGGDLNAGQITAQTIHGNAGGTARLSGIWSAGSVDLASNDIDILATTGGISAGSVGLFSTNGTQALIGDGLTGSGYALSNAEFGRIEGGSVFVLARGDASAAQDMLIGDLTVTGPSAGSTIEDSNGILVFATGDIDAETPGGVIRVVGDVVATGFGSGNAMEFYADRFELDAATGGISITSSGGALAGELGLYAGQIHVAAGSILGQLAANPQYSGYQDDLNAPAAVQRPEGVLNAASIWIESDNLQNILIQNTGTEDLPAGFLAQEIFVNDDEEIAGPPGSIDVVVNGQLQTEGGTLTGIAVRDALVEGEDLTPFTANSTINGCELVGDCSDGPIIGPIIGLPTEFSLIIDAGLPELPFDGDESSSAIQAPPALFDTRPLAPDGTVDEPISGSGNPALIDSGPTGGDQQCTAAGTEANQQCTPAANSGDQQ